MRGSVWEMIWMGVGSIGAAFGIGVCCQCVIGLAVLVMKSVPCLTEKTVIRLSCLVASLLAQAMRGLRICRLTAT